ncbi:TPA: iron-containing redox enzyme family protein, partial [Burkholderia multivorans]
EKTPLKPENLTFFFSHGETDKQHVVELWDVIERSKLNDEEVRWMEHATYIAGTFYRRMWDESLDFREYR